MSKVIPSKKYLKAPQIELKSGFQALFFKSVDEFDKQDWDNVLNPSYFFLNTSYLGILEKTTPKNLSFRYVLIYKNEIPVAVFYFQIIHIDVNELTSILKPIAAAKPVPLLGSSWSEWIGKCREEKGMRILISGNNFVSGEYGVAYREERYAKTIFPALADAVKHITRIDQDPVKISAILVKDYPAEQAKKTIYTLKRSQYHQFQVEPEMIVQLNPQWKSFDDYISAMSKKYRNRTKSVLRKTAHLKVLELDAEGIQNNLATLYSLYQKVHRKAKFRLAKLEPDYFLRLKQTFKDQFQLFAYIVDNEIVSFRSSFHIQATSYESQRLESHFIGLDYAMNSKLPLYQRILYDFVEEGITMQASSVYMGRTAAEMKSTVGAVANPLVCCIRHRNKLSNQIIRPFIDYLKPSEWIPRNPFATISVLSNETEN
jgi:hypothetical protein